MTPDTTSEEIAVAAMRSGEKYLGGLDLVDLSTAGVFIVVAVKDASSPIGLRWVGSREINLRYLADDLRGEAAGVAMAAFKHQTNSINLSDLQSRGVEPIAGCHGSGGVYLTQSDLIRGRRSVSHAIVGVAGLHRRINKAAADVIATTFCNLLLVRSELRAEAE